MLVNATAVGDGVMDVYTTGLMEWPLRKGRDDVREGGGHQRLLHISYFIAQLWSSI